MIDAPSGGAPEQAPRWDLVDIESCGGGIGMMKMATSEGSPLRQDAGTGSRLTFGGYRGLRRRNSRSNLRSDVLGYMEIYRRKKYVGGARGAHEGGGRAQGGGRAPLPRVLLEASLTSAPCLLDHVRSKNHAPEGFIPFGLRLIFLFCDTQKQGKNRN